MVNPERIAMVGTDTIVPTYAVAVLLSALVGVGITAAVHADAGLAAQASVSVGAAAAAPDPALALDSGGRAFTAALGNLLMIQGVSTLLMAWLLVTLMRFLTDAAVTFRQGVLAASAAASITMVGQVVRLVLQLATGSIEAGLHAGIGVDSARHIYLYAWLQRVDLFGLWEYGAAAVALASMAGLHRRFGYVVGLVTWVVTLSLFGGAALLAWIVGGAQ